MIQYLGAHAVYIPDTAFLYALIDEGVDTNGDNSISYSEAAEIISLNLGGDAWYDGQRDKRVQCIDYFDISETTGIEAFIHIDTLICHCSQLEELDVLFKNELSYLECSNNQLAELDVSDNHALEFLDCRYNHITNLDVSNNIFLTGMSCRDNYLTSLDLSNHTLIMNLDIWGMPALYKVCVWELPFPPAEITIFNSSGSPSLHFTTECTESEAPEVTVLDVDNQTDFIEVTSTLSGMIYLVPENSIPGLLHIQDVAIDSAIAIADSVVRLSVSGLDNGVYWAYAVDLNGTLSEHEAVTIEGVGIDWFSEMQIRIYPNSVKDLLSIENINSEPYSIEIISVDLFLFLFSSVCFQQLILDLSGHLNVLVELHAVHGTSAGE